MKKHSEMEISKNLVREFFRYIIPTILSMLTFSVYTIVDGIFVARGVGEEALAAVNLSSPYNACMFACGLLLAVGMATIIAMELGRGKRERASQLFTQNIFVSAVAALLITVLTLVNLEGLAELLGATQDTLDYVMEYIGVIAPFAVFFICAYNMEILVKTDGTPVFAMIGVLCAGVANVILDWLFVLVFHWGVKGAAFATGLAQALSVILYIVYFAICAKQIHFVKFRLDLKIYRKTLPLGAGDGITEFSNGIVIFLFNQAILSLLGNDGVVSYTVVGYVNTMVLMLMSGTAQGMQPLSSFYYGRYQWSKCRHLRRMAMTAAAIFGLLGWLCCHLFGDTIVAMFLRRSSHLFETSVDALRCYAWAFLIMGINVIGAAYFTSIGKASRSFPISFGRGLLFPALSVGLVVLSGKAELIWYAGVMAELLCLAVTGIEYATFKKDGIIAEEITK